MKTTLKNQYAQTNQILIFLVSFVFGYNVYNAIVHPEKSHLFLSFILLAITIYTCKKYGYKTKHEKEENN
ncbi:MAG: hypothetical protein K0R36_3044 [Chryseobacterium sp.]|jgi:hypothetical protein|uniref:hypothetical protein n=1 Tax=Chryseobacterium sp. TaxID=1871047 RepID=UPI002632B8D0|nr:hypothetical protein [Chryseobacterium sp.]MDF2551795.1 hypothetical protein [Chryseobacterium sp.]MDF2933713.1 hypothetical protein [Chryseobacterium sp.]